MLFFDFFLPLALRFFGTQRTQYIVTYYLLLTTYLFTTQYLNTFPFTITCCVFSSKVALPPLCTAALVMMQAIE